MIRQNVSFIQTSGWQSQGPPREIRTSFQFNNGHKNLGALTIHRFMQAYVSMKQSYIENWGVGEDSSHWAMLRFRYLCWSMEV